MKCEIDRIIKNIYLNKKNNKNKKKMFFSLKKQCIIIKKYERGRECEKKQKLKGSFILNCPLSSRQGK